MENMRKKGVALLMALIILATLSVLLVNSFEKSALEIKQNHYQEEHFQMNIMMHSMLRFFVNSIKVFGPNEVFKKLEEVNSVPDFPFQISADSNIFIVNPKIWSMDHYFFINFQDYQSSIGRGKYAMLKEVIKKKSQNSNLTDQQINEFIGSIKDYIDEDNLNSVGVVNGTEIFDYTQGRISKNRPLSFLREIKAIPGFNKLEITEYDQFNDLPWQPYIDQFANECPIAPLNVNMLPHQESAFAEMYDQYVAFTATEFLDGTLCKDLYAEFAKQAAALKEALFKSENRVKRELSCPLLNAGDLSDVFDNIDDNAELKTKFDKLFNCRSQLIGISFELELNKLVITVTAHLKLELDADINSAKPTLIEIVYFRIS